MTTYLYETLLAASVAFLLYVVFDMDKLDLDPRVEPIVYVTEHTDVGS